MSARDDFRASIGEFLRSKLAREGAYFVEREEIVGAGEASGVPTPLAGLMLDGLVAEGLLGFDRGIYTGGAQLILDYENEHRSAFYESNVPRRELLLAAANALDSGDRQVEFKSGSSENYTSRPWAEARGAAWILESTGLGTLDEAMGGTF